MTRWSIGDARNNFCEMLDAAVNGEVATITKHGKPVAAVIPVAMLPPASGLCVYIDRKSVIFTPE